MDDVEKSFLDTWLNVHLSLYGGNNLLFEEWCKKKSVSEESVTYLKLKFMEKINNRDRYVKSIRKVQETLCRLTDRFEDKKSIRSSME